MRLNQYLARHTGLSRRQADEAISSGRVEVNDQKAALGYKVEDNEEIRLDGQRVGYTQAKTILLNKPSGYISSRAQQGDTPTIYELLPEELHTLKPVGRLDKESRGLLLLTNDGELAQRLTNPKHKKTKVYCAQLDRPLKNADRQYIEQGVELEDITSQLNLDRISTDKWYISMKEGKNRQIRRTFEALNYKVTDLKRINFGDYELDGLAEGDWREVS